eukprot:gnl/TRDRNA2_/TRDRNA2_91857_c1_seq2.p1 gnl/TRDRNA2_/TRDRNA2_91857_c1~~gnl/TRDRNA2_/TRDRNA2_91857_c1_seq2.p1  ORF type:complete len:155 (-),score=33.84 gnl/TRDRNA2_/TRDRNA2_91857_c1_seq2:29-457(-)
MEAMVKTIETHLSSSSSGALSFLVVVPVWGAGVPYWEAMLASQFVRCSHIVAAAEHAFCDGAQHTLPTAASEPHHRPSSWDTGVVLLQNDAGADKWPLTTKALKSGFCKALRQAGAGGPSLQEWECRGPAKGGSAKRKRSDW